MPQDINLDPISGFPEFLPDEQILFNRMIDIVRRNFEQHGFSPIETPSVERKDVLTAKGADNKEIYTLSRLVPDEDEPDADTDLAMHFDLTVPLARYVVQHKNDLVFPFRRYQIQKVWRGERAAQGRYREFYQADIDVIGREKLGILNDAEIPSVIYKIFREMQIGEFVIRISNRKVLQGYLMSLGIDEANIAAVMRSADKLEKIGRSGVADELTSGEANVDATTAKKVIDFLENSSGKPTDNVLAMLKDMGDINETFTTGVDELSQVVEGVRNFGVPANYFALDLGVVRGLGYYTSTIYETTLVAHPELGSICSGGRYDNLTGYFSNDKMPGVGISIGLSRLIPQLIEAGVLEAGVAATAPVLITTLDNDAMNEYIKIAAELREGGIPAEVYLEGRRLKHQFKYADNKGFYIVIIAGGDEFEQNAVTVRNMKSGEEQLVKRDALVTTIADMLA